MSDRVKVFDINIDLLSMDSAAERVIQWVKEEHYLGCRFVVTPNVDHLVMLEENAAFKDAYNYASLVLVDGRPVSWALSLFGKKVPETVPGSDFVPYLFSKANNKDGFSGANFVLVWV